MASAKEPALEGMLAGTKYVPVRLLGRGGMGLVVEAVVSGLGKRVAVKLLSSPSGAPATAFEEDRLRVEAETLAHLESPHVVAVHDIGRTPKGQLYVVMELLRGQSLSEEVRHRGRLSVEVALLFARQVLLGLAKAHALGVVHRDVKPANVFLANGPDAYAPRTAKVLDFGVAKVLADAGHSPEGPRGPAPPMLPTAEGFLMGTPRYFSPEHVSSGPFDARTDVYGVGLLLYVMLTGRGPFDDETGLAGFARAAAHDPPPPPSTFAPDVVSAELDALVLKALEKRPERRYSSAKDFIAAIDACGARAPSAADRARPLPASRRSASGPPPALGPSSGAPSPSGSLPPPSRQLVTELIGDPSAPPAAFTPPRSPPLSPPAKREAPDDDPAARSGAARVRRKLADVPRTPVRRKLVKVGPFAVAMLVTLLAIGAVIAVVAWAAAAPR